MDSMNSWSYTGERFQARVTRAGIPNLVCLLKRFYDAYVVTATPPPRLRRRKVA